MKHLLTYIKNEILLRRFTPKINPAQILYKDTEENRNGYKIFKIVFQRFIYLGNMLEGPQRSAGHSLNTAGLVLASERGIFFHLRLTGAKSPRGS